MSRRGSITTNIEALALCKHTFAVIMQSGVSSKSVGPVTDTLVTLASSSQLELEHDIDSLALHISMYEPATQGTHIAYCLGPFHAPASRKWLVHLSSLLQSFFPVAAGAFPSLSSTCKYIPCA